MKTLKERLQEIKDEVARDNGYEFGFNEAAGAEDCPKFFVDQVSKRFAIEVAKEALDNAYEAAKDTLQEFAFKREGQLSKCLSESILSETNIPKL